MFLLADGTVKVSGGDQRLRTSTLIRDRPERGEEQEVLRGESDGLSSSAPIQDDSTRDDAEAKNDFWSITGDFIYRHHVEPRVQTVRAERRIISYSAEVHRRYQKYTYIIGCIVGENIDDYWNVNGEKRIIRCMDRLHKIHFIERKATSRIHMVRGEINEETNNLKTLQSMARYVEAYV